MDSQECCGFTKLAGPHGSIALVPRRNSRATWPGLFPPAITPAVERPARCTVTVPGDTGSVGDAVPHQQQASSRIWRVANPLSAFYRPRSRSDAPVPYRCTRSVAVHPIRRGVMPTDRAHRLPQQAKPRAISPHRTQPSASDAATRPRHAHPGSERETLHQLGSITPPPSWCNTPPSGVTPLSNKYRCGDMPRLSSRNARQRRLAAIKETTHDRETHASDEAADSSTHQLLGHSTTRTICACQPLRSLRGDKRTISNLLRHTSSHGR